MDRKVYRWKVDEVGPLVAEQDRSTLPRRRSSARQSRDSQDAWRSLERFVQRLPLLETLESESIERSARETP